MNLGWQPLAKDPIDTPLLVVVMALALFGVLMVGSASVAIGEKLTGNSSYFLIRQLLYLILSMGVAVVIWRIPLAVLRRYSTPLVLITGLLLFVVFLPGIGRTVNGSTRWLNLILFNFQVSELAKLAVILYLADYIVRKQQLLQLHIRAFLWPMGLIAVMALLLIFEPDFGSVVVVVATAMAMLFLAGVQLWVFAAVLLLALLALALLAITSPYRMERLTSYLNPWSDPFDSGFQLTQALIAFGRGEWFGVGLGSSVQKLFYLPEAHTDFVYAVVVEELGVVGGLVLLGVFIWWVHRLFQIGQHAVARQQLFGGYICYGIATWIALQTFINMGVNMGLLPTKGLSLPLLSFGGSNLLVNFAAMAVVMRVFTESNRSGTETAR